MFGRLMIEAVVSEPTSLPIKASGAFPPVHTRTCKGHWTRSGLRVSDKSRSWVRVQVSNTLSSNTPIMFSVWSTLIMPRPVPVHHSHSSLRLPALSWEAQAEIILEPESLLHKSYGTTRINEQYRCNYGPNPEHEKTLFGGSLCVAARDAAGEVRGGELRGHPFFVGTLFQPERRALRGELPPLVRDFMEALIRCQ